MAKITMKKEVKEKIQQYLINACEIFAENYDSNETDPAKLIKLVYGEFKNQFDHEIQRKGEQNAFKEWLRGLALPVEFSYNNIKQLVTEWFGQTEEEANVYSDSDTDKLYWQLLTREFFALVNKFKVDEMVDEVVVEEPTVDEVGEDFKPSDLDELVN